MIRTLGGGEPGSARIIESLPVLETPCVHARVAPQALLFGSNGSSRYVVCHLCRGGAGAHLMVAKNGKGKWRYLMFQLMFSLEGRAMCAWVARDDGLGGDWVRLVAKAQRVFGPRGARRGRAALKPRVGI